MARGLNKTVRLSLKGERELIRNLHRKNKDVLNAAEIAMEEAGEDLKERSNDLAPILTGALIGESYSETQRDGNAILTEVGYGPFGGESEDYAIFQHENFEIKRVPGRTWKYLETPFRDGIRRTISIIRDRVAGSLR